MGMDFLRDFVDGVLLNSLPEAGESIPRLRDVPMADILEHLPDNLLSDNHPFHYQPPHPLFVPNNNANFINEQTVY